MVSKGEQMKCDVCGIVCTVDDLCGCTECDIVCCGQPMKNIGKKKVIRRAPARKSARRRKK